MHVSVCQLHYPASHLLLTDVSLNWNGKNRDFHIYQERKYYHLIHLTLTSTNSLFRTDTSCFDMLAAEILFITLDIFFPGSAPAQSSWANNEPGIIKFHFHCYHPPGHLALSPTNIFIQDRYLETVWCVCTMQSTETQDHIDVDEVCRDVEVLFAVQASPLRGRHPFQFVSGNNLLNAFFSKI